MEREYELEKKKGRILQVPRPYERIIEIYKDAITEFEKINWNSQTIHLINSIRI